MKRFIAFCICSFLSISAFAFVDVSAKADPQTCKKGAYCKLFAHHHILVRNDSDNDKNYHYNVSICADNGDCWHEDRDFGVGAHQTFEKQIDSAVITRFVVVMDHTNWAQTQIRGAESGYTSNQSHVQVNY
jgi:hypothetical protein